ncbi:MULTISPECIES: fumarylacetoacetate hydrolase family protein [unclassified Burkholderia]|uniref:fumarylacetoacetate hydrolase family protein n=1 Tax=unclassified Burkholderia TaxID=2613784 RepID=UPI00141E6D83|nr:MULTISPECIES: fumarylacetoacetate hydrolase family protein [unclassified Burkholderia]NIE57319.1 fumarylacetoacetate hydrolase family protein [Burkholderia sp. Ap-955]NIF08045.1 fumarylacetoacetate hydrolase family protein [Burkholderia sp. Ax-1735]NIG02049.1 fumarylacetoacetate hydrolase family protein [Burkholderia sp. Tr-849]
MRLLRTGLPGRERPCAFGADGVVRDLSAWVDDWAGDALDPAFIDRLAERLVREGGTLPSVDVESERIGPPVCPRQIISIGLNYHRHAAEVGMAVPDEPIVSTKACNALSGPYDDIVIPPGAVKTDWEVELGIVIGRRAQYLQSPADACAHIAGYCTANDISERSWLLERGGQWFKGKSFETFAPLGPWLVTPHDVADPGALRLTCRVNGQLMQDDNTSDMIFGVAELVHYLSRFVILEPGDVILAGSPGGMALTRPGQPYLRAGDVVETEIAGLGVQRQHCREHAPVAVSA